MITDKYRGDFKDRIDVAAQFEQGVGNRWSEPLDFAPVEGFPTDEQILYASYEQEGYEGSAFVLFEREGKLYEVTASHCSCFGLEGQWDPEETTWDALAIRQPSNYGAPADVVDEAKSRVAA